MKFWRAYPLLLTCFSHLAKRDYESHSYFAVEINDEGNDKDAKETAISLAKELGLKYEGRVGELKNTFLFYGSKYELRKRDVSILYAMKSHASIKWSEEQFPKTTVFRRGTRAIKMPALPQIFMRDFETISNKLRIYDPGFKEQSHLFNHNISGNDLNLTGVWEQGI